MSKCVFCDSDPLILQPRKLSCAKKGILSLICRECKRSNFGVYENNPKHCERCGNDKFYRFKFVNLWICSVCDSPMKVKEIKGYKTVRCIGCSTIFSTNKNARKCFDCRKNKV